MVSALCSAVCGGAVDTRRAVDAVPAAMEVRRAGAGRFLVSAMPVAVLLWMVASRHRRLRRTGRQISSRPRTRRSRKRRAHREALLEKQSGQHVIFVRYASLPGPHQDRLQPGRHRRRAGRLGARYGPYRERTAPPLLCGTIILAFQTG